MKVVLVVCTFVCACLAVSPRLTEPPQGGQGGMNLEADGISGKCLLRPGTFQIQDYKNGTYGVLGDNRMFDNIVHDFQDLTIDNQHTIPYGQQELQNNMLILSDTPINHPLYNRHNYKDIRHSPCASKAVANYIPGTQITYIEYECHTTQRNTPPKNMVCGQMYQHRLLRYRGRDETGEKRIIKSVYLNQRSGCDLRFTKSHYNQNCARNTNPEAEQLC